jgi:hypothetical protein
LLDAERLQHVGELADLPVQVEVGERPPVAGLAFPDDRGGVAARGAHVAIEAVDADVELAVDEPLRVGGCQSSTCVHGRIHSSSPTGSSSWRG